MNPIMIRLNCKWNIKVAKENEGMLKVRQLKVCRDSSFEFMVDLKRKLLN